MWEVESEKYGGVTSAGVEGAVMEFCSGGSVCGAVVALRGMGHDAGRDALVAGDSGGQIVEEFGHMGVDRHEAVWGCEDGFGLVDGHGSTHYDEKIIRFRAGERFVKEWARAGNIDVMMDRPGGDAAKSFEGHMLDSVVDDYAC